MHKLTHFLAYTDGHIHRNTDTHSEHPHALREFYFAVGTKMKFYSVKRWINVSVLFWRNNSSKCPAALGKSVSLPVLLYFKMTRVKICAKIDWICLMTSLEMELMSVMVETLWLTEWPSFSAGCSEADQRGACLSSIEILPCFWRQIICSTFGADWSLLWSHSPTVGCWYPG